jgi:outer membrane lipoprotein-sorting protein
MRRFVSAALALVVLLVSAVPVLSGKNSSLLDKLGKKYSKIMGIEASFTQEARLGDVKKRRIFHGKVFLKPGLSRWEYTNPDRQIVVTRKDSFTLYDVEAKDAVMGHLEPEAVFVKGPFVDLPKRVKKLFNVKETEVPPVLILTPKRKEASLKSVEVEIDPVTMLIKSIETVDVLGNHNKITFSRVRINTELKKEIFHLHLPPDVTVTRQ